MRLEKIGKTFGATEVLRGIDLQINAGELFFLLGPSGCGKSTLLRIIAGLHAPSTGRIYFDDRDVTDVGTEQRSAVMCFQSYALWPHMTVRDNVRFGLEVRKIEKAEQEKRIGQALELVRMKGLADRKPNELSGGQQQRMALARAIAVNPDFLLLDEPLSNLDAKLRQEMRGEIRRICKSAGLTSIYVTHDQKEALSIADRIAVMHEGVIAQVGTPGELYHHPRNSFVADFLGQTNLLRGKVLSRDGQIVKVETEIGCVRARGDATGQVLLSIRPEQVRLEKKGDNEFSGQVIESTFLGEASEHVVQINNQRLRLVSAPPKFDLQGEVAIAFDAEDVVVLKD
jgi:iron(III) transport system ATP-binding protein